MKYVVIRFEQLPYDNIQKHVCVPEPWIKWRDESEEKVIVAYPVEDPAITRASVEKGVKYSRDWKCFMAVVDAEFPKYTAAVNYIKGLNDGGNSETDDSNRQPSRNHGSTDESEISVDPTRQKLGEPQKPKIVLPPEYNPNPRWSLKYPESNYNGSEDLIELELESGTKKTVKAGVFVDRLGYKKCFEESSDAGTLTRKLLLEIFNKSALQVCSLAGKGFRDRKDAELGKRPALYVHAVTALEDTVLRQYGASGTKSSEIRAYVNSALTCLRKKLNEK